MREVESRWRLNPRLDPQKLAELFRVKGRLHIPAFLHEEDAERLHSHLQRSVAWKLIINQDDKVFELDRQTQAAMAEAKRKELEAAVHKGARYGFQYWYESIRVPDDPKQRKAQGNLLYEFAQFLSSVPVISLFKEITGYEAIAFADAQATAYSPGHFLTGHDDEIGGKSRFAAYVLNLTPGWRPEWGGLLMFHGPGDHVEEAYTPSFNALNLFSVPQLHSVSLVTPFAARRRYSVTGWLRGRST